jgi:hypothetical protein
LEKNLKNNPENDNGLLQSAIESEKSASFIESEEKWPVVFGKFQEPARPFIGRTEAFSTATLSLTSMSKSFEVKM